MSSAFKSALFIGIVLFTGNYCRAQYKSSSYEFGISAGTLIYQGDLTPGAPGYLKTFTPALALYAAKSLSPYFSVRANLNLGKISADDAQYALPEWKRYRNFRFSTPVTELSALMVFNPYGQSIDNNRKLTPYVFAGAGVSFLAVNRDYSKMDTSLYGSKSTAVLGLAADIAHPVPQIVLIMPVGAGIRYAINPLIDLNAEATYRFTSSDYIDGFKYSANPEKRDSYYGVSLGVIFKIANYKCPPVKR